MTKEQKAIFSMNKWIEIAEQGDLDKFAIIEEDIEYFKVILNLIQEQKKDIEYKQDDINVLEAQRDSIENQFEHAKSELEKKDKIIDEMAMSLYDYANLEVVINCPAEYDENFDLSKCRMNLADRNCISCIKQYFERKAEV